MKPGQVIATDRRTTRRYFLFTPDEQGRLEQAFWYCLAVFAAKHGILVHAAILMATHIHLVFTDVLGVRPDFLRDFHRHFALCVKALRGWPEEVFNKSKYGEHELLTPKAILEGIAYLIGNPPTALAVRFAREWPGAITLAGDLGRRVIRVKRPDFFFDKDNPDWPDEVELQLTLPASLEVTYGEDETRRLIAERVREHERAALAESKARGIAFKNARRITRTPHTARARSFELFGKLNPRFSAAGDREAAEKKIAELRAFDGAYDVALAGWTAGDRTVLFPYGTWWMRVHHGARCHPPPS